MVPLECKTVISERPVLKRIACSRGPAAAAAHLVRAWQHQVREGRFRVKRTREAVQQPSSFDPSTAAVSILIFPRIGRHLC